jgi:SAM-dependent methyltransferase
MSSLSYSEHFADEGAALHYDENEYAPGTYSSMLWEIERSQLDRTIRAYAPSPFDYLDFACGTGRVLAHVAPRARSTRGIDISEAMVARARERVPSARIEARNITDGGDVEATYDVITSFRFLLNAEPELRLAGLKALAARLKDRSSVLIVNNHGNLASHKAVMVVPEWFRYRGRRRQSGNRLSHRAVVRAAEEAGLSIQRLAGCGLLGGRLAGRLPRGLVKRVEVWSARSPLSRLGSNQLYVARLR